MLTLPGRCHFVPRIVARPGGGRLLAMLLAVLGGLCGGALLSGTPAQAHAALLATEPANGAHLIVPPGEILLRFSERVSVLRTGVQLLDATGAAVDTGPATVDPGNPSRVRLPVPTNVPDGSYLISWRVVSADSHPVHGAFVFTVGDAPASGVPITFRQPRADPVLAVTFWLCRWLAYAGLALLAGAVWFCALCWPSGWADRRARRILATGGIASLVCALVALLAQGPYAAGRSLAGVLDPGLLAATLGTDYGRYLLARIGVLVVGGALLVVAPRPLGRSTQVAAHALLGVALPATWSGTGHANANANALGVLADTAHLVAMSAWLGGLVLLTAAVLPRAAAHPLGDVATALTRFSRLAMAAVGTLIVTGVYQAWRGLGSLAALPGTEYGELLVFKLAGVLLLVWIGAASRSMVRSHYVHPAAGTIARTPAGRGQRRAARSEQEQESRARAQLRRSVGLEVAVAIGVLALTSVLVATPPGARPELPTAAAVTAAIGPVSGPVGGDATFGAGGGLLRAEVNPGRVGANEVSIVVRDATGRAWDVPAVSAAFRLPDRDLGPLPVPLRRLAPGRYSSADVDLPIAGAWQLDVKVRTTEIDLYPITVQLPIRR
jgi:copper transport protein